MKLKSTLLYLIARIFGLASIMLRPFIKMETDSVLFWSWGGKQYGCNPKAISEYLIKYHINEFKLYWCFKEKIPPTLPSDIIVTKWGTLRYLLTALKCKYLISNTRNDIESMLFYKRKKQKYIMTWHAGIGLKKAEKDIEDTLDKGYIKKCKYDSRICDLMISGSEFQSNLFKNVFWYNGEILNCGTPRNDVLFSKNKIIRKNILNTYHLKDTILVLYAPTYRVKFNPDYISFDWNLIKTVIERKFNSKATLLVRLHPNISYMSNNLKFEFNGKDCIDVTSHPDMQELLIASDILITDYSSSMFDFSVMSKPCFLLVKDKEDYERDFYFSFKELPFDVACTDKNLAMLIEGFNETAYNHQIKKFNNKIGSFENGNACEAVHKWMISI